MGGDGIDVNSSIMFSSLSGQEHFGKDISAFWGRWMVMATSVRSPVCCRAVAHKIILSEAPGRHCDAHFQLSRI